jgi:hypothetical protein
MVPADSEVPELLAVDAEGLVVPVPLLPDVESPVDVARPVVPPPLEATPLDASVLVPVVPLDALVAVAVIEVEVPTAPVEPLLEVEREVVGKPASGTPPSG